MKPADRHEFFARLRAANPDPRSELSYASPYELLVAVILSAQADAARARHAGRQARLARDAREHDERLSAQAAPAAAAVSADDPKRVAIAAALARARVRAAGRPQ